jgi:DNA-3-methyladenine glycosylase II
VRADIEKCLARNDPDLARVITAVVARIGPQRIAPSSAKPFEALVRAIVYQGVAGTVAASIFNRVKEELSAPLAPSDIAVLHRQFLLNAGLSAAKAGAIQRLAEWFTANGRRAKALPNLPDDEIIKALTAIPGIGLWTTNVFLIFGLGRLDVLPAPDLGIRRSVSLTYGLRTIATPTQVLERSQAWRPYRSIASIYLWKAGKLKLKSVDLDKGK